MPRPFCIPDPSEYLAEYLKEELVRGRWTGTMPGQAKLVAELGVGTKTVRNALALLEKEGLLVSQGKRRGRAIAIEHMRKGNGLRVGILPYEPDSRQQNYIAGLIHQLDAKGHEVHFARRSLLEMKFNVSKVAREVESASVDAWVIEGGSAEVLEWFSLRPTPCFALFGRKESLNIAGTHVVTTAAYRETVARLVELGHRRIVFFTPQERRKPKPGLTEMAFLEALESQGIPTGNYNLPDWEESIEGFHSCLDSLFAVTPPTALIFGQLELFLAANQHLLRRGLRIPEDVSLISSAYLTELEWCRPSVAHIHWEPNLLVRRVLRWVDNISRGREDNRQSGSKARLIEGGTLGPARQ